LMTMFLGSYLTKAVSALLIVCVAALHLPATALGADDQAEEALKKIQYKYYFRGQYEQAIGELQTLLARTDLPQNVEVPAREFLAASYVLTGKTEKGSEQFLHLLNEHEGYSGPNPAKFKAEVVQVYVSTRDALAAVKLRTPEASGGGGAAGQSASTSSKPIYKKWWFYVGLAAVALVVVGATTSQEDEGEPTPPTPTGTITVGVTVQ
jgi:ABC-type cobalt transport system substrate-binding protein